MADLSYIINFASNTLGIDRANSAINKLGVALAAIGVGVAAVKVKNFFADSITGAAEFEQQLATVQAVSGATAEEMGKIKLASEDLGKSTRYNSTQAAEGFEILARAGLNVDESLKTIPSVLALAQGNALELGEAAGFVTKAVQGMGLSFDDSGRVADVMAKAAASANTDVRGLGSALSYAAPSAAALGVSVEQAAAYIGKFADAGIDASRAGTSFNGMLSQFGNSASSFKRELVNMGITTSDFNEAIHQLAAAGPSGQKAINALGLEAGPALKALLSQGMGSLDDLTNKLYEAGGTAQNQADVMNDTWQGALASLGSAWQYLKDTLGESFLDSMTGSFNDLSKVITDLVDSGKIRQLGDSAAEVFSNATNYVIDFVSNMDMADIIDKVSNSLGYLETIAVAANGAFQALNIGFQAVKSGLLAMGMAVSLVVEGVAGQFKLLIDAGRAIGGAFGLTTEALDGLSEGLQGAKDGAAAFRKFASDEIVSAKDSIVGSMKSIGGATDDVAEKSYSMEEQVAAAFTDMVKAAKDGASDTGVATEVIRDNTRRMIDSFKNPEQFAALIRQIKDTGQEAVVGSELLARLGEGASKGSEEAKKAAVWAGEASRKAATEATEAVKNMGTAAEQAADATKSAIEGTFSSLGIDVGKSLTGISAKTKQVFDLVATGSNDVANSTYNATEKAKLLAALFAEGLNAATTKEEFAELNEIIKHNGLSSVVTAEQHKILNAGMQGGTEAVTAATEATNSHTAALDNNTSSTNWNSGAVRENTREREQQSISVWNAKFATDEATKSESASLAFMQRSTAAIREKIGALNQLSGSTETADESYKKLMRNMGFVDGYKWSSMEDFARDMERVNAAVDRQAESYSEKNMKYRKNSGGSNSSDFVSNSAPPQSERRYEAPQNSSNDAPTKTIKVEFKTPTGAVNATIPASQEAMFEDLLKQLAESKAIAGY